MNQKVRHVFLVGAKSLGAYGGYETFIDRLTEYHQNDSRIKYHVACKANGQGAMDPLTTEGAVVRTYAPDGRVKVFEYHNAECFCISIPEKLGPAQAIYYDCMALEECIRTIKRDKIRHAIVYIMACRIGPLMQHYYKAIHRLGGRVYLNPDGHEWMRGKWSVPVRKYWMLSEQLMVKWSDLVICDSVKIEEYIHECYDGKGLRGRNPKTTFIAYGAEARLSACDDSQYTSWLKEKGLKDKEYYLVVGRFVPENNYETILTEFMKSSTSKDFALITNADSRFLAELERKTNFVSDHRIKFVGTVYDKELLMKIRENAYGYFHGHEVGGTNPSLLEALASTRLNLLLDVGFNREVAEDTAVYWTKEAGNLAHLIDEMDTWSEAEREALGQKAKERIRSAYSWQFISSRYAEEFLKKGEI